MKKLIKSFNDFFTSSHFAPVMESLENRLTMVCVSHNPDSMYEIQYLRNACSKLDVNFIHVDFAKEENFIKVVGGQCVLCMGERMYELEKSKTVILKRHAKMSNSAVMHNFNILKNNDYLIINTSASASICKDKVKTAKYLEKAKVPCPRSLVIDNKNIDDFSNLMAGFKPEYPVIAKVNRGSQGIGVFIFDNEQSLKGVAQYIVTNKRDSNDFNSLIIQEKIDAECDLRLHVVRQESDPTFRKGDNYVVIAAMKRNKIDDDYRSNASLGATYEWYTPTDDEIEVAAKAAAAVGCAWCGVDLMRDRKTKKLYVLEVNCTPSLKGITAVAKKDPATEFVKVMKEAFQRFNIEGHKKEKMVLGYKETFYINDFDEPLIALLDTGNSSLTSLRVKHIKVDEESGMVEWTLLGKKFKTKYDGDVGYMSSGGSRIKQPTTRIDITHNGVTYKNIRIKLSSVEGIDKRVLNINRDLLSKMNAVIDTSKKHVNDTIYDIKKRKK